MEINFCRRCGQKLTKKHPGMFICAAGHEIYYSSPAAVAVFIVNDKDEVLLITRAVEPKKDTLDAPGGFCDGSETLEEAIARELQEELGITSQDYNPPQFLMSGANTYEYLGEVLQPLDIAFWVRVPQHFAVTPASDAAEAAWYPLKTLDIDKKVGFTTVRQALKELRRQLGITV